MEFLISPEDMVDWTIEAEPFRDLVLERFPGTRSFPRLQGSAMELSLEVPDTRSALQVSLSQDPSGLHVEGDLAVAADFASWWATQAPSLEPAVRIYYTPDLARSVVLRRDITPQEIVEALR